MYIMEAQRVYIKLMRLILKSTSNLSQRRIKELNSGIGELRQLLSCAVCCQLLMDPYKPKGRRCGHHVCRLCLRGQKHLYPTCSQCADCSDFKTYEENKSMALQLLCYKTLCVHLLNSSVYGQLERQKPNLFSIYTVQNTPRIKLPVRSTHWFIHEGAQYEDMCETFLPQPDSMSFRSIPGALPAETPPTTAATTPELTYEQHMPEQLSITDIELEAAATGDQTHFSQPLPLIPSGARMLSHGHIAPAAEMMLPASYIEPSWTEQVDLSAAFPVSTYGHTASDYTTYVVPSNELHLPAIGQVVQIPQHITTTVLDPPATDPGTSHEANTGFKRSHAEMLEESEDKLEDVPTAPAESSGIGKRVGLRSQKPTILSSVVVKLPTIDTATSKPVTLAKLDELPVPQASTYKKNKFKEARRLHICRCGTTSGTGFTTCRNNRCTCYIAGKTCVDCKCVGCKNPHQGDIEDNTNDENHQIEECSQPPATVEEPVAAAQTQLQTGYHLVPLDNLQQTQHPLVLIQNEHGQYQGFNIFNGTEPMDPALAGFQRVPLRSNDGNNSIPQYAYVMPTPATMETTAEQLPSSSAIVEQSPKKFKHNIGEDTLTPVGDCSLSSFSPIESVEEFVSGSSTSNAVAGDSLTTDKAHSFEKRANTSFENKAHSLFEDIMSGSDDLLCNVRHEVVSESPHMPYICVL